MIDIRLYAVFGLVGLGISPGCSVQKVKGNQHNDPTEIRLGDFRGDPDAPVAETALNEAETAGNPGDSAARVDPAAHRAPITSGEGGLAFLDAKVGDISGHPIYVTSFFEPIEDRLIAISEQERDVNKWRRQAGDIINSRLNGIIYDELLRAETLASLSPQQRVGLQSFLKDFRSNVLSENMGSAQLADRRFREDQGITLDEALRQKELDTLVGLTLYQEINRRINISWRDIKQRYERDIDKYQPPPTVTLQVIRVLEGEGELVDSITARLNGGEDFSSIAASELNNFNTKTQGKTESVIEESFEETKFFAPEPLNEAVYGLSLGEWTGPVSLGNANFWIKYLDRVQESKTLYEAQLEIQRELTNERRTIERHEYLTDLIERARVSSAEEILMRLIFIAERKYGPMG